MTFAIVAVPSRQRSTEEFQSLLNSSSALYMSDNNSLAANDKKDSEKASFSSLPIKIRIVETSRLMDNEDGQAYFVVSVEISPREDNDDAWLLASAGPTTSASSSLDAMLQTLQHEVDADAELWVNSEGPLPLAPPYGWKLETFSCRDPSDAKTICHNLHEYGLAIVQPMTSTTNQNNNDKNVYQTAKDKILEHILEYETIVLEHHPQIELGVSPFGFQEFTHRGPQRFEILLDDDSATYQWLKDRLEPQWLDTVCEYLSVSDVTHLRLGISCVYSRPGSPDQEWHTDGGNYSSDAQAKPYAVCIFCPLVPLTKDTGYTRFWPRSHAYSKHLLGLGQAGEVALQATVDSVGLGPGDFVLYSYETWHKGVGHEASSDTAIRPILQFLYSNDWYKERKNYGERSIHE